MLSTAIADISAPGQLILYAVTGYISAPGQLILNIGILGSFWHRVTDNEHNHWLKFIPQRY